MAKSRSKRETAHTRLELARALAFIRKAKMGDEYLAFMASNLKSQGRK